MYAVLRIAALKFGSADHDEASRTIPGVNFEADRANILYPAFKGSR
jgi:hypothetical protein